MHVWEFQNTLTNQWFQIRDRAITGVDGRVIRLEIATDITERKIAEAELKRADEELRKAYDELGTFCQVLKQIGVQQTLEGVGSLLMKELQVIVKSRFMRLFLFSSSRSTLFILTENGAVELMSG